MFMPYNRKQILFFEQNEIDQENGNEGSVNEEVVEERSGTPASNRESPAASRSRTHSHSRSPSPKRKRSYSRSR